MSKKIEGLSERISKKIEESVKNGKKRLDIIYAININKKSRKEKQPAYMPEHKFHKPS